jgi:hypothetical protein
MEKQALRGPVVPVDIRGVAELALVLRGLLVNEVFDE